MCSKARLAGILCVFFFFGNPAAAQISPLDPGQARPDTSGKILWYDVQLLGVEGRGWEDTESYYDRLPARAKALVREPVWDLSRNSSGLCVRFLTDAVEIRAAWDGGHGLPHMAATGASGVDLYRKEDGEWRFIRVGKPEAGWTAGPIHDLPSPVQPGEQGGNRHTERSNYLARAAAGWPADSVLRHFDHPGRLRLTARHGLSGDPGPLAGA